MSQRTLPMLGSNLGEKNATINVIHWKIVSYKKK